ncbi:SRPBCC family protein [Gordonia polyisoprenivorans]|uniref:SRPBCC family protein n=1 Tax=Gordonia polyisoprenivorans TaxID=84595 RepID=UPI000B99D8A8|nr:SRPBCC family protein [Gordonia polyisoprenivorans]OZC32625.1 polyketide cyclase [Gordonia polyisoprenivorans]
MKPVTVHSTAAPEHIWAVLSDGWLYSSWVVGAARIRAVDDGWPAIGSRIHHSVGVWPGLINDETRSLGAGETTLELSAAAVPFGHARILLEILPDPDGTRLTMAEHAETAPMSWLPDDVQHMVMAPRLRECLRRLASMAEGHARSSPG